MAELADARTQNPLSLRTCGFNSHRGHKEEHMKVTRHKRRPRIAVEDDVYYKIGDDVFEAKVKAIERGWYITKSGETLRKLRRYRLTKKVRK